VDGHEYRRVHKEMRRKRVPNIFDVDGQQVVAGTDGTSLWERRRYRACKKGAVLVEYTNGKVDSKERVATQAAGQSVDGVSTGSPVRITKIAFNPPGIDLPVTNAKLNREYVALKNVSRRPGWLTGWVLKDKIVDGHRFRFPRFRLGPGRYVRIHTGSGRNDRNDLYWNAENYIWNNSEPDRATLKAPRASWHGVGIPRTLLAQRDAEGRGIALHADKTPNRTHGDPDSRASNTSARLGVGGKCASLVRRGRRHHPPAIGEVPSPHWRRCAGDDGVRWARKHPSSQPAS
jgi:Lamin Tail Domain